jgi:putative aldouronate transport system permease protein
MEKRPIIKTEACIDGCTISRWISRISFGKRVAKNWQMYVFLLLPVIYLIIFCYWPMLGAQIAFRKYKIRLGIWGSEWVGLYQFRKFFSSYYFVRVIGNTLRLSLYSIIVGFPLPIIFALQMNAMRSSRVRKLAQTVTYMPHFISVVTLVGMISQMLGVRFGIFAQIYRMVYGANATVPNLLLSSEAFPHIYVISGLWQSLGWNTVIYTAALAAVDPTLHEAATIDGASRIKRIIHVDMPAIIPTISIMLILRFGQIMNIGFDKVYLLQSESNLPTSEVIATYVYKVAFSNRNVDYSYGTAIGLFNSVVGLIMLTLMNALSRKIASESLW